jgi:rSAM/selenodomain-associated transferase 2
VAPTVGVVIPTLNEAAYLPEILHDISQVGLPHEVVVADGGSHDDTLTVARAAGARVVSAPRGRGLQLNAGAAAVAGEWLCFLHADVRMPQAARTELERAVADTAVLAAVWGLRIDAGGFWPRFMELGNVLRDRIGGLPYGDQGLLVRRELFATVGGFPPFPIMEDVALIRLLGRRTHIERLGAPLGVSPRRWLREGPYRTWIRNSLLLSAYLAGASPQRLARWYRPEIL